MFREGVVLATSPHRLKHIKWDKVFKNGPSKICGRQPLKSLKGYVLLRQIKNSFSVGFGCTVYCILI